MRSRSPTPPTNGHRAPRAVFLFYFLILFSNTCFFIFLCYGFKRGSWSVACRLVPLGREPNAPSEPYPSRNSAPPQRPPAAAPQPFDPSRDRGLFFYIIVVILRPARGREMTHLVLLRKQRRLAAGPSLTRGLRARIAVRVQMEF